MFAALAALAALAGVAHAAPGAITLDVKNEQLSSLAAKLSQQSGCRIAAFNGPTVDLSVANASLWEVLSDLEAKQKIFSRVQYGTITLDPNGSARSNMPAQRGSFLSWVTEWRSKGPWAIALVGGQGWSAPPPPQGESRARLMLIGQLPYSIDKLVIDAAVADKKPVKVTTNIRAASACHIAELDIVIPVPTVTKLSLRGHLVLKTSKLIERKVEVPIDDRVVDIAEGRLRIHVASKPVGAQRDIHIGWDNMGETVQISADVVDDQGASVRSSGRGSGTSSSGQGYESRTVAATGGKLFVVLRIPGGPAADEKLPFKFDDEKLTP
jgi:hypothetical protein